MDLLKIILKMKITTTNILTGKYPMKLFIITGFIDFENLQYCINITVIYIF